MIISFNPHIFQTSDDNVKDILKDILLNVIKQDVHIFDMQSIYSLFFNENNDYVFDNTSLAKNFFSKNDRLNLREYILKNRRPITSLHKKHLSSIKIGLNESNNEIKPEYANKIIAERSKIILENGINDWNFIKGICQKYTSHKERKSIYQLIYNSMIDDFIEPNNAGGFGEIKKIVQQNIDGDRFKEIFKYKLMALFDSDKTIEAGNVTDTPHKAELEFFKKKTITTISITDYEYEENDLIVWHILYKRKLENYVPLSILFEKLRISDDYQSNFENASETELDYINYDNNNIGLGEKRIKEEFPKIFLENFSYRLLEQRCEHHKKFSQEVNAEISEMEQILLKIAKII